MTNHFWAARVHHAKHLTRPMRPLPTWRCEFCGRFYSERTAKDHAYCVQEEDRRNAERAGAFDV